MKSAPVVIKNRHCSQPKKLKYNNLFEHILSEVSFSENYSANSYIDGINHLLQPYELPEWYPLVQPHKANESLAEEIFLLASEYYKNGERDKAIAVLQKALDRYPDNLHYKLYLLVWQRAQRPY